MNTVLATDSGSRSFFDLGFRTSDDEGAHNRQPARQERSMKTGPPPLMLGRKKSSLTWEVAAWIAAAAGIFARQGLILPDMVWTPANITAGAAIASVVVGLAVFPMMMRWLNRKRRKANLEHIAGPFAFGFFLDLAVLAATKLPASITSSI